MGQQQLLLVILVTIIVGIATVVAINVFGTSAENANVDAVRQDMLAAATTAQGWFIKPQMMDGGGNSFDGLELANLNIPGTLNAAGDLVTNENGTYQFQGAPGGAGIDAEFILEGQPSSRVADPLILTVGFANVNGRLVPELTWGDVDTL